MDIAITEFTPVLERETHLRVMPLFEEIIYVCAQITSTSYDCTSPLSQFTNQSLYCLEPMTNKSKLIEKTKGTSTNDFRYETRSTYFES